MMSLAITGLPTMYSEVRFAVPDSDVTAPWSARNMIISPRGPAIRSISLLTSLQVAFRAICRSLIKSAKLLLKSIDKIRII